jgi:hypothetical protein
MRSSKWRSAHVVVGKTEAAFRRGDLFEKRQRLMDAWDDYCGAQETGKIFSIRDRKATRGT